MIKQLSTYLLKILLTITLVQLSTKESIAQCGSTSGVGGFDPIEENFCGGEKRVWIGKRFSAVDVPAGTDVHILVDWGYAGAVEYYPTVFDGAGYAIDNTPLVPPVGAPLFPNDRYAYHVYPTDLVNCDYQVDVSVVFVDAGETPGLHPSTIICPGTTNSVSTIYWEKDNIAPGALAIERAPLITICEGQSVTIDPLENITTYNCPLSNNNGDRWFQWVYNTNGGNPIPDININGANITNQDFNVFGTGYSNADLEEIVQLDPGPNIFAGDLQMDPTGTITVDGTNTAVGQTFEITLRAWNTCNPFDDPDTPFVPDFTDAATAENPPVETIVTIEIVAAPEPNPEVEDPNNPGSWFDNTDPVTEFCAGEPINFRQLAIDANDLVTWDFDWDNNPANFNDEDNGGSVSHIYDNSYIGQTVTVGLRIERGNIGEPCIFYETIQVRIIETPEAIISTNGSTAVDTLSYCRGELPIDLSLTDATTSKNTFTTTQWQVFDNGGNDITPSGALVQASSSSAYNPAELAPYAITSAMGPGQYTIRLTILDGATSCSTEDELVVFVYDDPLATFTTDVVCEGNLDPENRTSFSNISAITEGINPIVNGDEIINWYWDFSYNSAVGFNTELSTSNNNDFSRFLDGTDGTVEPSASAPGTYNVALVVETAAGCTDTLVNTVTVRHNPNAAFYATYTNNYEGNNAGDLYTGDPICPGTLLSFTNNTNESLNNASVGVVNYQLEIDSLGFIVYRDIGAPGDADETIDLNIFFNNTGSNQTYTFRLLATANNTCETLSNPILVDVLPGSPSGFEIYEEPTFTDTYSSLSSYCSPYEFYFRIDNVTNNLLSAGDSIIWLVQDGADILGGDTVQYTSGNVADYDFSFLFENDFPSIAPINYTITLRPFASGVCVNNAQSSVRVLPKPISTFFPTDTIVSCDSVTYYFEAEQSGLLDYIWTASPADNDATNDTIRAEDGSRSDTYWVSFGRPPSTDPALNISVNLQTINPFNCSSDVSADFTDVIAPTDDFFIDLNYTGTETCIPATYNFINNTIPADIPANTNWELRIVNIDLGTTVILDGADQSPGNEDFSAGIDYEFTQAGNYEITLNAILESTCDISSDPPISLSLNNRPNMRFRPVQTEGCSPLSIDIIDASSNPSGNNLDQISLSWENLSSGAIEDTVVNNQPADYFDALAPFELLYTVDEASGYNDYRLTLTGTNEFGCTDDSVFVVRVYEAPQIDFAVSSVNPACEEDYTFAFEVNNFIAPAGTTLTWNWGDGQPVLVTDVDSTVTHAYFNRASYFGSDSYIVSLQAATPDGCTTTVTDTVNLLPLVRADFFMDKNIGCSPLTVNFSSLSLGTGLNGNFRYQYRVIGAPTWTEVASADITNTGQTSIEFNNTTTADLQYEIRLIAASSVGGCSDTSDIQEITVYPQVDAPGIEGPQTVCAFEQNVSYNIPAATANASSTYFWTVPPGAFISSQNANASEVTINFSSFSGNISVTEINATGCLSTPSTLNVNVLTGPSGELSLNGPSVICPGESTSLLFTLDGPGSANFDVIYNNGLSNDTLFNIPNGYVHTVSPTNSTNYILLSVVDREYPNCIPSSITGSAFVNVNIAPTATLTGDATICEGTSTNLFFNLTGVGPWDVVYTDGTSNYTFTSTNAVYIEMVTPTANTVYEVVSVRDGNTPTSCVGTVSGTATVDVNSQPEALLSGNQNNVCANSPVELTLNLRGNAPWMVRYTDGINTYTLNNINAPAGYDPATDTYQHVFTVTPPTGVTTYTLVDVRDINNCLGDVAGSATVEAFDPPEVSLSGNASICEGQSTTLNLSFVGDAPFQLSYLANADTITLANLNYGDNITVSPNTSTVYRIIELLDARSCSGMSLGSPVSVNVNSLPTASLSGADTICYGDETDLVFDFTGVGPWTVTYTDGTNDYTFTTTFNRHFEAVSPTTTRNYSIISVTDGNSPACSNTGTGNPQVFVYPELTASFTVTPESMELPKSDVDIVNTTTNKGAWTYLWEFGDGTTSTEADPGNHVYETYGDYLIRLTATNGQCTDTYQIPVSIGAIPPEVDFVATPLEGCIPLVVDFENRTRYADPSTYLWEFGDGKRIRAVENPTHVYTSPGVYSVRLYANNITGQERELLREDYITVYETPQASFTIPDEFRQVFTGEEVQFINTSVGADQYIWMFGDGSESFEENPVHNYADSGIYDITLIAINSTTGCEDSFKLDAQIKVVLGGESKIANAFTPSRSGPGSASANILSNDIFLPQLKGVREFNMKIYNRWGELLFESNDKTVGWDGYYQGQLMPQAVYVYRLELVFDNGRREIKVGDVTLIR